MGAGAPVPRPVGPALVPPLRGAFFVPWSCRPKGYPDKVANGAATCRSRAGFSPSRPGVEIGNAFGGSGKLGGAVGSMIVKSASRIARTAQTGYSYLSGRSAVLPTRLLGQSLMLSSRRVTCALRSSHFRSRAKRTAFSRIGLARSRDSSSDSRLQICSRSEDSPCGGPRASCSFDHPPRASCSFDQPGFLCPDFPRSVRPGAANLRTRARSKTSRLDPAKDFKRRAANLAASDLQACSGVIVLDGMTPAGCRASSRERPALAGPALFGVFGAAMIGFVASIGGGFVSIGGSLAR